MEPFKIRKYSTPVQCLIGVTLIGAIAVISYLSANIIGYQVVALMLLLAVSILAMLFDILPVLLTAFLSALIWNFFFIPPTFTFHVGRPEDVLLFLMYFVIALLNAVLSFKIREYEKKSRNKEEREKTIKLYNTLLNSLSHELRTPISTIIGAIDTIKDNNTKLSQNHLKELFFEIEKASIRLNRQVDNLLNMSRLESGFLKPKFDWCDVNELVFTVINNNKNESPNHHIEFNPEENLPLFKIDRGLIEQVLHNIIHNALQHTPEYTTITIKVSQEGQNCCFIISDNGAGFPEKEIAFVFDKFYRLPASLTGGTGLGLSIAKGFAEAHNGVIRLENESAGGAKFTIEIPAETSPIHNEYQHE